MSNINWREIFWPFGSGSFKAPASVGEETVEGPALDDSAYIVVTEVHPDHSDNSWLITVDLFMEKNGNRRKVKQWREWTDSPESLRMKKLTLERKAEIEAKRLRIVAQTNAQYNTGPTERKLDV